MPLYEWKCDDCVVFWEDLYNKPEDAPRKRKCPKCGKMRDRAVSTFGMNFIGDGFYCNDYGKNTAHHSSREGAAKEFINDAKKMSEKRMASGWQNYARYEPNVENQMKAGRITRKKSAAEVRQTLKTSKKLTDSAYNNAGIDPLKSIKKKPQ